MKTVYLFVGAPGMGKTTLCNFQSLPVIHYDDYSRDKIRQKLKISCIDFCVQLINSNENEKIVFDYHNLHYLKRSLNKLKNNNIVLIIMDISKEKWKSNLIIRNGNWDRTTVLKKFDYWFLKYEKLKEYVKTTEYKKIYITDDIMDKVVNGTLIPNFEEM